MRAVVLVGLLALAGCSSTDPAPTSPMRSAAPARSAAPTGLLAPGADGKLHGKVAERIDASSYTYLRLRDGNDEVWAAVPTTTAAVGSKVTIVGPQPMPGFESKTLNRRWDMIYFGNGVEGEGAPAGHASAGGLPPGHPGGDASAAPAADQTDVHVDKATGPDARTVAEVWAQKADLKDKNVSVHGKVVKATSGVLDRTWIHLRDGSGSDAAKDNDITVTTTEAASLGEIVTVRGVVHLDRDLGSGYQYPVIIEDAKLTR